MFANNLEQTIENESATTIIRTFVMHRNSKLSARNFLYNIVYYIYVYVYRIYAIPPCYSMRLLLTQFEEVIEYYSCAELILTSSLFVLRTQDKTM